MRAPRLAYLLTASPILKFGAEVVIEGLTTETFWTTIPWPLIYAFSAGVFIALLINDLQDKSSWIMQNIRSWRSVFRLSDVAVKSMNDPERLVPSVQIQFKKTTKHPKVNIYGTGLVGAKVSARTLLFSTTLPDQSKDQYTWVDLGCLMVPRPGWTPRHSVWGQEIGPSDLGPNIYPIIDRQNYLIEVEVNGYTYPLEIRRQNNKSSDGIGLTIITYDDAERIVGY